MSHTRRPVAGVRLSGVLTRDLRKRRLLRPDQSVDGARPLTLKQMWIGGVEQHLRTGAPRWLRALWRRPAWGAPGACAWTAAHAVLYSASQVYPVPLANLYCIRVAKDGLVELAWPVATDDHPASADEAPDPPPGVRPDGTPRARYALATTRWDAGTRAEEIVVALSRARAAFVIQLEPHSRARAERLIADLADVAFH